MVGRDVVRVPAVVAFACGGSSSLMAPDTEKISATLGKYAGVEKATPFKAASSRSGFLKSASIDRCVTCHLGYDWGAVLPATLVEPLMPHPNLPYMDQASILSNSAARLATVAGLGTTLAGRTGRKGLGRSHALRAWRNVTE